MVSEIFLLLFMIVEDMVVYWAGINGISKFLVVGVALFVFFYRNMLLNILRWFLNKIGLKLF